MKNDTRKLTVLSDDGIAYDAESGCYVEGHWGQYAMGRLADVCEAFGIAVPTDDDPRAHHEVAENADDDGVRFAAFEAEMWASDALLDRLNDRTDGGYWYWQDGELFLIDDDDAEDWSA